MLHHHYHRLRHHCLLLYHYASSSSSPLPVITLESSSTVNLSFSLFSNASNNMESDESINLFPTFNSLDDFFSQWIPDNVLADFCSSLDDFCIATADPLYEDSNFLLTCVHFFFTLCFLFLETSPSPFLLYLSLNAANFFQSHFTIPCLYMLRTHFYKIFLLLLGDHSLLNICT